MKTKRIVTPTIEELERLFNLPSDPKSKPAQSASSPNFDRTTRELASDNKERLNGYWHMGIAGITILYDTITAGSDSAGHFLAMLAGGTASEEPADLFEKVWLEIDRFYKDAERNLPEAIDELRALAEKLVQGVGELSNDYYKGYVAENWKQTPRS